MKALDRSGMCAVVCGALVLAVGASVRTQSVPPPEPPSVAVQRQIHVLRSTNAATPATLTASGAREVSRLIARRSPGPSRVTAQADQQPQRRGWIRRHPKLFGALVGFGVGCPLGAAQVGGSEDDFFNALDEFACPFLGGVGAAVGAGIGAALSR